METACGGGERDDVVDDHIALYSSEFVTFVSKVDEKHPINCLLVLDNLV